MRKLSTISLRIIKLSLPVMMGQISFSVLNFVDRYFIAKLGIDEAAGSSLSSTIVWVLMTVSTLITGGTIALVSRKTGERNLAEVSKSAEQSLLLGAGVSIIITAAAYIFSENLIGFYNAEQNVEILGNKYFSILVLGYPFVMLGAVAGAIFQASGNTRTPMMTFMFMSVINLILDPMFIFGFGPIPRMEVEGAATATLLSEFLATSVILILLFRDKGLGLGVFRAFIPELSMIKRILRIGVWSGMNSFSRPISAIFLMKIITFHGTSCVAAFSFGIQWISIIFIFMQGMAVAISTMVGQFLGGGDFENAVLTTRKGLKFGMLFIMIIMAVGIPSAHWAISIFTADDAVINAGAGYLIIVLAGMMFHVPMTVYSAAFNGAGDTAPPTVIAFIANWVGKIGVAALTTYAFVLDIHWVWLAISLSIVIEGIGLWIWFRRGTWKHKTV